VDILICGSFEYGIVIHRYLELFTLVCYYKTEKGWVCIPGWPAWPASPEWLLFETEVGCGAGGGIDCSSGCGGLYWASMGAPVLAHDHGSNP
jgi:hypothetical protein